MDSVDFEEVALQSVDAPLGILDTIGAKSPTLQDITIQKDPVSKGAAASIHQMLC